MSALKKKKHISEVKSSKKTYSFYRRSVTIAGKRRDIRAKSKKEWEAKVASLRSTYVDGLDEIDVRTLTVQKACEFFVKESKLQLKNGIIREKTFEEREYVIRRYILPSMGDIKISRLDVNLVEETYKKIILSQKNGLGKCARTHKILNKLMNWLARKKRGILRNPIPTGLMGDLKREYKNLAEDKPSLNLKLSDIRRILEYSKGRKQEVIVHLQSLHGLRISEALAIRYEDIDFINNKIIVKNQTSKGRLVPVKTKSARRSIPLQEGTREILQNSPNVMTGGFVCKDSNGGPVRYSNYLNRFFTPMMKELGLRFTTHNLRTFFASWCLVEGKIDVVTVSKWMGHSSPTVTMDIYAKTIEESENRYDNRIGNAVMPPTRAA